MMMIVRGHDDGIDALFHFREHLAVVLVTFGIGVFRATSRKRAFVHIT